MTSLLRNSLKRQQIKQMLDLVLSQKTHKICDAADISETVGEATITSIDEQLDQTMLNYFNKVTRGGKSYMTSSDTIRSKTKIYSVQLLFWYLQQHSAVECPAREVDVRDIKFDANEKMWSHRENVENYNNNNNIQIERMISPQDVMQCPRKYSRHYYRIMDIRGDWPIILSREMIIIDGNHRMMRALLENDATIVAHIVPDSALEACRINSPRPTVEELVRLAMKI